MGEEVRSFHMDEIVDGSFAMIRLMVEILHAVLSSTRDGRISEASKAVRHYYILLRYPT